MKIIITIEKDENEVVNFEVNEIGRNQRTKESVSDYARFFDEACPGWCKDHEFNLIYLKHQQTFANEVLRCKGYLFLNEVYDMLGIPRTKAGQVVGWIYNEKNPNGNNYIDFDIFSKRNHDFVNGYEKTVLLDFNVDGIILDKI